MLEIFDRCIKTYIAVMVFDLIVRAVDFWFSPPSPRHESPVDVKILALICAVAATVVVVGVVLRAFYVTMAGCMIASAIGISLAFGWVDDIALWPPTEWRNASRYVANSAAWALAAVYAWVEAGIYRERKKSRLEARRADD